MFPIPRYYSLILLIAVLAGCGMLSPQPGGQATPTSAPSFTPVLQDATTLPTAPASATALPTPAASPGPLPQFPLDGYVIVFIKDGDLYFQDGAQAPVQLSRHEKIPASVLISDDNRKIVFLGEAGDLNATNTDGSHTLVVIPAGWPNSLAPGTKRGPARFVPKTHQLFFETVLCRSDGTNLPCPTSAFLADTDTGKIRKLADLGPVLSETGLDGDPRNIKISPDGTMLAAGDVDGMDLFTLDGRRLRDHVIPYKPSTDSLRFPTLSWLPDSSGLIVALPDQIYTTQACDDLPAHSIWRYTITGNTTTQIPLDPPPMMHTFEISPDGNRIAYGGYCQPSLYLGNLANGQTQVFGQDDNHPNFSWSPDSQHLIIGRSLIVTSFAKPPAAITGDGSGWIDPSHFIAQQEQVLIAEIRGDEIFYAESGFVRPSVVTIIRPKQ